MSNLNPLFEYQTIESRDAGREAAKKIAMIRKLDTDRRKGRKVAQFAEPLIRKGKLAVGRDWSDAYKFHLPKEAVGAKNGVEFDAGGMFADTHDPILHKRAKANVWSNGRIVKEVPGRQVLAKTGFKHKFSRFGGINKLGSDEMIYA